MKNYYQQVKINFPATRKFLLPDSAKPASMSMRSLLIFLVAIFLIFTGVHSFAAIRIKQVITGRITDGDTKEPLPGVNIMIKGTSTGTATDANGNYSLEAVGSEAVLVVSFVGYLKKEIPIKNQTIIHVSLMPDLAQLNEVVVIGYGTAKKSDLTGSVARLDAETFKTQPLTQVTDMLTGTVAGFSGNQNTSAAGGSSMEIRGPNSLNAASDPMIVLDNAIYNGSISDINPSDIATIDILKDASSAAVYGARAASGVIIITTKKGASGQTTVNFSTKIGVTQAANAFKSFDGEGYLDYRRDVLRAMVPGNPGYYFHNPNALPAGVTLDQWRRASNNPEPDNTLEWLSRLRFFPTEIENYQAGKTVDWYDKVMQSGFRQNYDVSVAGGTDKVKYYWSGGYDNNQGVIVGDKFSAFRTRLNVDFDVSKWLTLGINSQFADRDQSVVQADLIGMLRTSPYGSEYNKNGNLNWWPGDYPGGENPLINYYGQDRLKRDYSLFASIYARLKLPFGFDYKLSVQPRYQFGKDYNYWSSKTIIGGSTHSQGYGTRNETSGYERIIDNLLHWNKELGIHNFDLTLLYSSEQNRTFYTQLTNETFVPNQNLGYNALQFGSNPSLNNNDTEITGDAVMARLNYGLLNKYLFTASVRRDGYSAFGQKNPRATFPAAAFAWQVSEEDFFQVPVINRLKVRLSWGVNGNRQIGAYSALAQLNSNMYYDGTNVQVGVYNNTLANPNLVWEKTKSVNLGVDMGLFNNRLDISLDYYDMTTTDLLMNRLLPQITGFTSITSNLGELGNKGFELTMNTVNVNQPKFSWRSHLVFSLNRNKIKKLFGDYEAVTIDGKTVRREVPDYSNEWFPGQAIDRVWNYELLGIWQLDEAANAAEYRMKPGDFKALDVDGSRAYEALTDKKFIGYEQPRYRFGVRNDFNFLKNFSASIFVRADLGHIGALPEALHQGSETYDRRNTWALPYWSPDNPTNDYARLIVNENAYGGGIRIYKSRSFVRIQDLSLSYALPSDIAPLLKLNNLRIFGSVRNLYSFDKWPAWDPESGDTPMPRTLTFGLDFSL
ncbi:MAG: SusC/RagA family TonB-linked outer membrane protein [Adhaeribacter sp.]|nr:SusC/RagA family TonB-linked outer membrane protein [Adhaeribacter sp.]